MSISRRGLLAASAVATLPATAFAETDRLRLSHGYSIAYLPLMVVRDRQLIEKHAKALGLGTVSVGWTTQDGGNNINDAMLAGALDVAGTGVPGFLVLRDRTLGRRTELVGLAALDAGALWLNTIDPRIKSLADYRSGDKIAVPGIKTSYAAVVLQMAAAKAFGMADHARLDPLTVGMPHPEAFQAMMSGKTEIKSHMASPPFSYQEVKNPAVHRVLTTADVIGPLTILLAMVQKGFAEANPGLMRATLLALEEADAFIKADREAVAAIYGRQSGMRVPHDEIIAMLADPENVYDVTPDGSMAYAEFLAQTGVLKNRPSSWKELFLPILHDRKGS